MDLASEAVELDQLPKLNEELERKSPKRLLVELDTFENDCLRIHFLTESEANKIEQKN